jgi:multidrug resistance efflux pump
MEVDMLRATATAFSIRPRWIRAADARIDGQIVGVTAGMYGRVERVCATAGQLVEAGDLLVELDHRELDRRIEVAADELARPIDAARSGGNGVLSRVEIPPSPDARRAQGRYMVARMQRAKAEMRAPITGRVLEVRARPGEHVALAQPVASILESDDLWVLARFETSDYARLRVGQPATVSVSGHLFPARVCGLVGPNEPALLDFAERPSVALHPGTLALASVAAG